MSKFSQFIRKYLADNNMSVGDFATKVGFTADGVRSWLCDKTSPTIVGRTIIASSLGYELKDFEREAFDKEILTPHKFTRVTSLFLKYMADNGITCKELAVQMGVNYSNTLAWSSGKHNPAPRNIHDIATFFGISDVELAYMVTCSAGVDYMSRMGCMLRTLRYSLGATSRQIADSLGVTNPATWICWEARVVRPDDISAKIVADWLGVNVTYVYSAFDNPKWDDISVDELTRLYNYITRNREAMSCANLVSSF